MIMSPIRKNYIDTRQRTPDSAIHSDFSVDIPTALLMPEDTGCCVEDIRIPASWWTVEKGKNDMIIGVYSNGSSALSFQCAISHGNYTTEELVI